MAHGKSTPSSATSFLHRRQKKETKK
ncbi:hypothetical protein CCACVL1_29338 [Corchorus capsularis]|uniref:Uncharacterized protein n=1 Tax=Corchorus capsularis TaxID=210143 RepID=A0A1R3G224_COCAP|nr:hypothetical protein CCACVL1_29338 [Corchorus capsularis]